MELYTDLSVWRRIVIQILRWLRDAWVFNIQQKQVSSLVCVSNGNSTTKGYYFQNRSTTRGSMIFCVKWLIFFCYQNFITGIYLYRQMLYCFLMQTMFRLLQSLLLFFCTRSAMILKLYVNKNLLWLMSILNANTYICMY